MVVAALYAALYWGALDLWPFATPRGFVPRELDVVSERPSPPLPSGWCNGETKPLLVWGQRRPGARDAEKTVHGSGYIGAARCSGIIINKRSRCEHSLKHAVVYRG